MLAYRSLSLVFWLGTVLPASALTGVDCCSQLSAALGSDVATPNATTSVPGTVSMYQILNTGRWSNTAILSPSCIFRPASVDHLSQAVQILRQGSCNFAIKSGGHMPIPGANNIDDGVSIDLQFLNQTVLSDDKKTARLGAGARWINAYNALSGQGVGFPGGLCGTTGVGGVTLGGGQSIFSSRIGWIVDSIVNYEIVLASGEVTNANATNNSDLFVALKGGGSNFGIVTRVDLKTFQYDSQLWGGQIVVPALPDLVDRALEETTKYTTANNNFTDAALQTVFFYYSNGDAIIDFALASTNNTVNPDIFAPFAALEPQVHNTVASRPMPDLIEEIIPTQPEGYRQLWATVTFKNDLATIQEVHNITNAIFAQTNATVPDMDWIFFYSPQPKVIETYGDNMLNLKGLQHDQMVVFITPRWLDAAYDPTMYAAASQWVDKITAATKALGTDDPFLYLNFAAGFQKPLCAYGSEKVRFLQQTAAKYDPSGVFQTLVPGGFKVSQAC